MTPESQVLLSVGIPTIAVLVGILLNNRQIESLRAEMIARFQSVDVRFQAMDAKFDARFQALEERINSLNETMNARFDGAHQALLRVEGVMDARLRHLEERD